LPVKAGIFRLAGSLNHIIPMLPEPCIMFICNEFLTELVVFTGTAIAMPRLKFLKYAVVTILYSCHLGLPESPIRSSFLGTHPKRTPPPLRWFGS